MVQEPPEGGFAAEALGYPIFAVGETLEELNEMVRDAVICHFGRSGANLFVRKRQRSLDRDKGYIHHGRQALRARPARRSAGQIPRACGRAHAAQYAGEFSEITGAESLAE
jgi:hypothetical protein